MMGNWKEVTIDDIANLYQGLAINKKTNYLLVEKSSLPLLRIKDLQENTQEIFIDDKEVSEKCIANEDDLIFTRTGIVGLVFMGKKGVVHNNCFRIVPKNDDIYLPFYYYYFNRDNMRDYLTNISAGSVQPDMNHSIFKTIKVPKPPLKEQKAIAEVLSSLDDKIDLLHRQNKTLENIAQTLFRQYFIEEANDEWEEKELHEIINISSGKPLKRIYFDDFGKYEVLGANGKIGKTNKWLIDEQVIFTGRVGTLGKVFILSENKKAWFSDNTLIIKPKKFFYYIYFLLKKIKLEDFNVGSTQPLIRQTDIKNLSIKIPNDNLIIEFENQSKIFFDKIAKNIKQIKTLENLRDTLLPKLMSGKEKILNG